MNNIHGRRVNMDVLTRKGSGYTATHAPDLMRATDPWFVGVSLAYGPDGGVYVSDFSDTGECHHTRNTRKHTGRIYKITYGKPKPWRGTSASSRSRSSPRCNCTTMTGLFVMPGAYCMSGWITRTKSGAHLVGPGENHAAWRSFVSALRRDGYVLNDNSLNTKVCPSACARCGPCTDRRREADDLMKLFKDRNEHVRAWAIQLLMNDFRMAKGAVASLTEMAENDKSPLVRLYLASAAQRVPVNLRAPLLKALLAHGEDVDDESTAHVLVRHRTGCGGRSQDRRATPRRLQAPQSPPIHHSADGDWT